MTPIVRRLGPKANPAMLKTIPIKSYLFWLFYAGEALSFYHVTSNSKEEWQPVLTYVSEWAGSKCLVAFHGSDNGARPGKKSEVSNILFL